MKLLHLLLLSVTLFWANHFYLYAQNEEEKLPVSVLLDRLDDAIAHKKEYQQLRFARADSLLNLAYKQKGEERIQTLTDLYNIYLHFQTDSALSTLDKIRQLPEYATDRKLQLNSQMDEARVYGMMGFYYTAFKMLDSIRLSECDAETRLRYYNVQHAIMDWRADYALRTVPSIWPEMHEDARIWHDSILIYEPEEVNRTIVRTNRYYDYGDYQLCIDSLLALMGHCNPEQRTFAYSRLSEAYGKTDEPAMQLRYLILTAISDIRAGITEYMALPELAAQLFRMGDVDRAYEYLFCALEDANLCKSNLRTIEVSTIFPIIEESRHERLELEKRDTRLIIASLLMLALIMTLVIFTLIRLNKKLQTTRRLLAEANDNLKVSNLQLQKANKGLQLSDQIKGEYLMNYLDRSHNYLGSIESIQRQMLKLVQSRQIDELTKKLKSTDFVEEELQKFYTDFDEVFLTLYPNFVEKFNALLKPEAAIIPKRGELLTTELRIFALIRMGETDSTKIAKFLNYSLTTIYNYRSRVRNNALGDKETFEQEVMQL
jgi:hypothetical protein